MPEKGFLHKVGGFIGSIVSEKKKISTQKMPKKVAKKVKTPVSRFRANSKRQRAVIKRKIRTAHKPIRKHVEVFARQRVSVRKETQMPAPWSRVEKYKKVKKEGFGSYY